MIRWAVNKLRRLWRYPLKQQGLNSPDPAIRMETPAHNAAVDDIIDRHKSHALMVSHVGVNDHSFAALLFPLPRIVQRLIKSHPSEHARLFETFKVFYRLHRLDEQRESRRVRRYNQIVLQASFQAKRRNTERLILINFVNIEAAISGFGNSPWDASFSRVLDLAFHRCFASIFEKRVPKAT